MQPEQGTVLIFDEEESRAATAQAMAATARSYGFGGQELPPQVIAMTPPQTVYAPQEFLPSQLQPTVILPSPSGHLLITPSTRQGMVRLVRMQGPTKLESWTLHQDAAMIVISMLTAFGITWSDLRESEEE
jgi:hypothetical protein